METTGIEPANCIPPVRPYHLGHDPANDHNHNQ